MKDVFVLQDEIARAIVTALKVKLTDEPGLALVEPHTSKVDAYALYLKARYFWRRKSASGLRKGIEYFQQAIAIDPGYSLAYAGLADSYITLGYYSYLPPKDVFPPAKAAADAAIGIDDGLAEAHTARACVSLLYDWDWLDAERRFQRAIELKEGYPTAHFWYACYLWAVGRTADSCEEAARALALAPLSLVGHANLGWALYFGRRFDDAIAQCRKSLELDPRYLFTHTVLGQAYVAASRCDEAVSALESAVNLSGGLAFTTAALGHAYARAGKRRDARKVLETLKQRSDVEYVPPFCFAVIYAGLGDKDQAFAWLDRACEERSHWVAYLKTWPLFDDLRADARFGALLGRVGLGS